MAKTGGDIKGHLYMIVHQELYVFLDELANLLSSFWLRSRRTYEWPQLPH